MGWTATLGAYAPTRRDTALNAAAPLVSLVFCAIMFTEPVLNALIANEVIAKSDLVRLVWAPVYLVLAWIAWRDRSLILAAAARTPLLSAATALALLSPLWSVASDVSFRRAVGLLATMLFAWRLSALRWRDMTRVAAAALFAMGVLSVAFALAWPQAGIMGAASPHPGAWAGVWPHKNVLGNLMGLATGLFLAASINDPNRRRLWLSGLAMAIALCVLSTSATALLLVAVSGGLVALGLLIRRGALWATILSLACASVVLALWLISTMSPTFFFDLLGRDATLTGRTEIWEESLRAIAERPGLGYGFGAFWEAEDGPAFFVRSAIGWDAPNAHSGWLDLALALGWGAVALVAISAAATAVRAIFAMASTPAALAAAPFVAGLLLLTATEGYALQEHSLPWAVFVAMAAKLASRERNASGDA